MICPSYIQPILIQHFFFFFAIVASLVVDPVIYLYEKQVNFTDDTHSWWQRYNDYRIGFC